MHNGLIREFPQLRRELVLAVDDSLFTSIEGTTDSETMFYLALTFGLESDPVGAVEQMVGFVEETGRRHGVEHPIQMTIADDRRAQRLRVPLLERRRIAVALLQHADGCAARPLYPEIEELAGLSDETRVVVSEPLGDLEGAWNEVPESHVGIIQPGDDELRPFSRRSDERAPAVSTAAALKCRRLASMHDGVLSVSGGFANGRQWIARSRVVWSPSMLGAPRSFLDRRSLVSCATTPSVGLATGVIVSATAAIVVGSGVLMLGARPQRVPEHLGRNGWAPKPSRPSGMGTSRRSTPRAGSSPASSCCTASPS